MYVKDLAKFVLRDLQNAHGGVLNWSEADAFLDIYKKCFEVLELKWEEDFEDRPSKLKVYLGEHLVF